ncbi:zinc finger MYM-type protein 5-like [Myzus persicae]|uniref:zinc finger MYM-type protein 5-like n=1 Tax=Myzus persicae TaxID=13164 RepID=UPI000B936715|nr:zinc finger MYM-type protein 5-like [Myzus persicae]
MISKYQVPVITNLDQDVGDVSQIEAQSASSTTEKITITKYEVPVITDLDQNVGDVVSEIEGQSASLTTEKNITKYQVPVITDLDQDVGNVVNAIEEQLVIPPPSNSTDSAYDSVQSILIDKSVEYPSDPDLFRDTILSKPLIRALMEIGPCQPGIDGKYFIFPKNKNGQSFLVKWYEQITKSNFPCKRNWLVYSPNSNKMFCFPCFLFRTVSQHHYQWSDPSKGVSNFRKGHEKIVKHEKSN